MTFWIFIYYDILNIHLWKSSFYYNLSQTSYTCKRNTSNIGTRSANSKCCLVKLHQVQYTINTYSVDVRLKDNLQRNDGRSTDMHNSMGSLLCSLLRIGFLFQHNACDLWRSANWLHWPPMLNSYLYYRTLKEEWEFRIRWLFIFELAIGQNTQYILAYTLHTNECTIPL